jgi:hypothetical protein
VNAWSTVLPLDHTGPLYWLYIGLICLVATIVVVVFGPARLSRKSAKAMAYITDPVRTDGTSLHEPE